MVFNVFDDIRYFAYGAVLRRLRRMSALSSDAHGEIGIALFRDAYARKIALENMLDVDGQYGSALIYDAVKMDSAGLECVHNGLCAGAFRCNDFLVMTEAEIDVSLGLIALFKKRLDGFHNADEVILHIQSASAPDKLAVVISAERLVSPVSLRAGLNGNNILVGEQSDRLKVGILSLPAVEQARLGDILALKGLMYQRIRILKIFVEFFKLRPIDFLVLGIRDGRNLNSSAQMLCHTLDINMLILEGLCLPLFGEEEHGSDKRNDNENAESYQNTVKYFGSHCFSPFTPRGETN